MRKPLIAGNWKMYKTTEEAVSFAKKFAELYKADETDVRTAICAPFTQLAALKTAFAGTGIMRAHRTFTLQMREHIQEKSR